MISRLKKKKKTKIENFSFNSSQQLFHILISLTEIQFDISNILTSFLINNNSNNNLSLFFEKQCEGWLGFACHEMCRIYL